MKIDMHLHSKYSKRPSQWVLQKIGCPESFSEPMMLDRLRKKQGMGAFTLTDHNTIGGALEIAHLPRTFISEEITTYFPEDGCKVHVLAYDINEAIHADIQKIRENIYDLVEYLCANRVVHAVAHPMYSVNDRLTLAHFQKFLLLFKTFELNGARDDGSNQVLREVLQNLTPADIGHLADMHDLAPKMDRPEQKRLIGGSDDHSALNVARMHTEVVEAEDYKDFLKGVVEGKARPCGRGSGPKALAHNLYGIAYQFYNHRFNIRKYANQDLLMRFLNRVLIPEPEAGGWIPIKWYDLVNARKRARVASSDKMEDVIRHEGEKAINTDPLLTEIIKSGGDRPHADAEERWFRFVNQVCNQVIHRFGSAVFQNLSGANLFSIFGTIGAAGSLYAMMAPYFVSYNLFGRDRLFARTIQDDLGHVPRPAGEAGPIKVAHFTDTFYEINGVAWTLRQQAELARKAGKDLAVITCGHDRGVEVQGRVVNFEPLEVFEMPEYPEQKIYLPPFLEMLTEIHEQGYTYIHSATPGPVGLCALGIARILGLPISGTYHTAIPEYAKYLTGDDGVAQMVWRYTAWYYDQMEKIYVPSLETGRELTQKGIDPDKILLYPRGVDTREFNPSKRNGYFERRWGLGREFKLLYVGRVSKEKNLHLLVKAFKEINRRRPDVQLVVIGDGPYGKEMREALDGWPATFTGYIQGPELAEAFASADLFVFPSTTDTFGNVILEAQASGLPVVVTDVGGPRENVRPGQTGLVVPGDDPAALVDGIMTLTEDKVKLKRMGNAARKYMEERSFEKAFQEHWKLYSREQMDAHHHPHQPAGLAKVS